MSLIPIYFFSEDINYLVEAQNAVRTWIKSCVLNENKRLTEINYIFCSDEYLLGLNQTYLSHNSYTDILTFDHSSREGYLEADIFISVDRVLENSITFKSGETHEMHRVMIHGILHLCGMKDLTLEQKTAMRKAEDLYLSRRPSSSLQ
jgi:probable rRNA maturation factor